VRGLAALSAGSDFVLLSDQPVGDQGQGDLLSRSAAARQLAELIRASQSAAPFTLAVYADWGMGKSSLLRQVADQFADSAQVETVWFNAWTATRADALESLIKSVLDRLDPQVLRRLARRAGSATGPWAWIRVLMRGLAGAVRLQSLVDEVWNQLSIDARTRNEARDLLRGALTRWTAEGGHGAGGRMIVVFVDDLDRCEPEVIKTVCDAIKLYLDIPGLVFVLGCDRAVIETAVTDPEPFGRAAIGRRYLEKIVQAAYPIPVPTNDEARALVKGYADQSGTAELFEGAVGEAVAKHAGRNPRRIKRLINRFVIEYRLDVEWQRFGPAMLIRVIVLQDFYPEFFSLFAWAEGRDPIDEICDYFAVRAADLTRPSVDEEIRARIKRLLDDGSIPDDGPLILGTLERVEQLLPPIYLELATDRTFVGLVNELAETTADDAFRAKLHRRRHAAVAVDPELLPGSDLTGVDILWLSRYRERSSVSVPSLRHLGALVTWAENGDEAIRMLRVRAPKAVVTHLTRAGDRDGGFADIVRIREEAGYSGPIMIHTRADITPARRAQADSLNVPITQDLDVLIGWLAELRGPAE
jgi:KAP family P-loop domain